MIDIIHKINNKEFNHNIDFEYELRCFVFKGNLTVITQYNNFIYLRKMIDNKQNTKCDIFILER